MVYVIEPVVGFINTALNNGLKNMSGANIILLGALLGAMMAVDMGGPVNKAAYVFGTAQIAAGNYDIMAAVMIGGMVPPIAIAIASLLFKNKFTEQERKAGAYKLRYGTFLHHRGSNSIRRSRSVTCHSGMCGWCRCRWRTFRSV